jgi:hypothetical protein
MSAKLSAGWRGGYFVVFSRTLLCGLALLVSFTPGERAGATGAPPCMGSRPALFATPTPARAFSGQTVTINGVGLSHYQSPVITFFSRSAGGQVSLANPANNTSAKIQSDTSLTFDVPRSVGPGTYQLYAWDQVIANSPAVCMNMTNANMYTVPADADCGSDLVMCFAAPDHLRSLTYATLEVLPPRPQATVRITNTKEPANPLCQGTPVVTQADAFFDANSNGIVEGYPNASTTVNFPADLVPNILGRLSYDILPGTMYASNNNQRANLVVAAIFSSCPHNGQQFVVAHFYLSGLSGGPNFHVTPVKMLAGDLFNEIGPTENSQKGVVMNGGFDGTLDAEKRIGGLIEGQAVGSVTRITPAADIYGARIEFRFSLLEELR